jgi:hypothetical protein
MIAPYTNLPSYKQWLSDSNLLLSSRKGDPILLNIDGLVTACEHASENVRRLLIVDLFWNCDFWLKEQPRNPSMKKDRATAIHRLFVCCAKQLCGYFGCEVNTLVNHLEECFGRTVGVHGLKVDVELGWVKYFDEAERKLYKLEFNGGKAYQFEWWSTPVNLRKKVLANSRYACDPGAFFGTGADKTDFGGFVMTMGRDLYMARHGGPSRKASRVFHSSYFGNNTVSCAGTMLIRNGEIEVICPDSGHFQPGDVNVMMLLRALQMHQVDLSKVMVQDFKGNNIGYASAILRKNDWNDVLQFAKKNLQTLQENQAKLRDLTKPKPPAAPVSAVNNNVIYYKDSGSDRYIRTPAEPTQQVVYYS